MQVGFEKNTKYARKLMIIGQFVQFIFNSWRLFVQEHDSGIKDISCLNLFY